MSFSAVILAAAAIAASNCSVWPGNSSSSSVRSSRVLSPSNFMSCTWPKPAALVADVPASELLLAAPTAAPTAAALLATALSALLEGALLTLSGMVSEPYCCRATRLWYRPPCWTRESCVPISATEPLSMTTVTSALRTVDSRCAITMTVRSRAAMAASSAPCTWASLSASRALVASSRIRNLGRRTNARANAIRCFWPPDSNLSVTTVSKP
mmetsp:Transcript_6527/g.17496  ORF Transcript_6527/g.17496 Transcript_6527/m.17496 type:complete len:212 (-) Transcript_6527:1760-2395(-)